MRLPKSTLARLLWVSIALTVIASSKPATAQQSVLINAIQQGDHERLAKALKRRADPNKRLPDGSLPLAWAIERQDSIAVALLLRHKARVNDLDPDGNPLRPLIVGCLYPTDEVLDQLLNAQLLNSKRDPLEVNTRGPEGIPALSFCAAHAPANYVQRLLAAGASVSAADANGQTALMWAAAHARLDNFDLLLAAGADINRRSKGGFTPLMFAVKSGDPSISARAVAAGANAQATSPDGTNLLQLALYQSNFRFAEQIVAEQLLEDVGVIAQFDRNGRQPLHAAVIANQPALVRRLLDAGADINALTTESKVRWRYESNFRAGDYQFPRLSPLLLAAQQGHGELLTLLAERGANTQALGDDGDTLLLTAAASNRPDALEAALLLSQDVNASNERGDTALHRVLASASGVNLAAMLATLARHGARTDIENVKGKTASDIASDEHFKSRQTFAQLFRPTE